MIKGAEHSPSSSYLGSEVIRVVSLGGREVGTQHSLGHGNGDLQILHSLPHGLLGADSDVQSTTRPRLEEVDALLHVHWNGHEAEKASKHT